MSWHVQASGKKINALDFCFKQQYFLENAPIQVQSALKALAGYFPDDAVVSIQCNGHLQTEGGNIRIEIQNIPAWVEGVK